MRGAHEDVDTKIESGVLLRVALAHVPTPGNAGPSPAYARGARPVLVHTDRALHYLCSLSPVASIAVVAAAARAAAARRRLQVTARRYYEVYYEATATLLRGYHEATTRLSYLSLILSLFALFAPLPPYYPPPLSNLSLPFFSGLSHIFFLGLQGLIPLRDQSR